MPSTRPTLGVSFWPDFDYDASGATTLGVVGDPDPSNPGAVHLVFDVTTFEGPPVRPHGRFSASRCPRASA